MSDFKFKHEREFIMMKKMVFVKRGLALAIASMMVLGVSVKDASAHDHFGSGGWGGGGGGWGGGTPVGPITDVITAVNYDESGGVVNALLTGTTLLKFSKKTCDGIGALGQAGDSVTYSGSQHTLTSGVVVVSVTTFINNTTLDSYPPTPNPKPSAYPLTDGVITALNVNTDTGLTDGFLFTPTVGTPVFVGIGNNVSTTLSALLIVGTPVSVTGILESPDTCAPVGTISEVDASSLTIGTTVYTIGDDNEGH